MSRVLFVVSFALMTAGGRPLTAQQGMLDERTQFTLLTGPGQAGNTHGPLQAVVLWHGREGWDRTATDLERHRVDSIYRWERFRADEAGNSFFGSGLHYGILSGDRKTVSIEGRRLDLSRRDSVLIIMVSVPPVGQPRTVSTVYVEDRLPPDYWPKTGRSGDTTFFVQIDFRRQNAMLMELLTRSPVVAAFLR